MSNNVIRVGSNSSDKRKNRRRHKRKPLRPSVYALKTNTPEHQRSLSRKSEEMQKSSGGCLSYCCSTMSARCEKWCCRSKKVEPDNPSKRSWCVEFFSNLFSCKSRCKKRSKRLSEELHIPEASDSNHKIHSLSTNKSQPSEKKKEKDKEIERDSYVVRTKDFDDNEK